MALDGEVSNSTHADEFAKAYPGRYFEMFIAEQQLVAAAVGLSVRHYVPFASTFAAFFTRAYDFIRMAAISQANVRLSGSHSGVEIGADGPSQMVGEPGRDRARVTVQQIPVGQGAEVLAVDAAHELHGFPPGPPGVIVDAAPDEQRAGQ